MIPISSGRCEKFTSEIYPKSNICGIKPSVARNYYLIARAEPKTFASYDGES